MSLFPFGGAVPVAVEPLMRAFRPHGKQKNAPSRNFFKILMLTTEPGERYGGLVEPGEAIFPHACKHGWQALAETVPLRKRGLVPIAGLAGWVLGFGHSLFLRFCRHGSLGTGCWQGVVLN